MSHIHSQFQTSLIGSNDHQLGQWFSTGGNFASLETCANVWKLFDYNWQGCY